ncbi:MAG: hypothetical protein IJY08_01495 [Clostridia bacterium]|nr:hypothetical protein [Clostridia bacterium]
MERKPIADREKNFKEIMLASDEQKRLWLFKIIDEELGKEEASRDTELLRVCMEWEASLSSSAPVMSKEEVIQRLEDIKVRAAKAATAKESKDKGTGESEGSDESDDPDPASLKTAQAVPAEEIKKPKKLSRPFRVIAIVAAVIILLIATLAIVAKVQDTTPWALISDNISKLVNSGDSIDDNNVTLTKNGVSQKYSSIEEALKNGNIDIMYPSVLPEGVTIEEIYQVHNGNEDIYEIMFSSNSPEFSLNVSNNPTTSIESLTNATIHDINGIKYYVQSKGTIYQATCIHNGFEYSIIYDNSSELIDVLEGMKVIEK